ncbi:MAG: helix-turn-helix domain-containing protein [Bacilli bacterium]
MKTVSEKLIEFWASEWEIDGVYEALDFAKKYGVTRQAIVKVLNKMHDLGMVIIVRDEGCTYYIRSEWMRVFGDFGIMRTGRDKKVVE